MKSDSKSILYSSIRSPHSLKMAMFLSEKGIPFSRVEVDLRAREQKSAAYLALNLQGQVPAYEDDWGVHYDSLQIMLYVEERYPKPRLFPTDEKTRADVLAWIELSGERMRDVSHELYWQLIEPPAAGTDYALVAALKAEGLALLEQVEASLQESMWLCGELSAADIALFPWIYGYQRFDMPEPGTFPLVEAWRDRISNRHSFIDNFGQVGTPFAERED